MIKDIKNHSPHWGVVMLFTGLLAYTPSVLLAKDYFDPALLSLTGQDQPVDLSQFATPGEAPEGNYLVNVFINQQRSAEHNILFKKDAEGKLKPQLSLAFMYQLGVNKLALEGVGTLPEDAPISALEKTIPGSLYEFNFQQLTLNISVPQIYMQPNSEYDVDPALYDNGVSAFMLNYSVNGSHNNTQDNSMGKQRQDNYFVNLQTGLNWQAWRLRSNFTYSNMNSSFLNGSQTSSRFSNIYLQRAIIPWQAELTLGEQSTSSEVFDSVPLRGVVLQSSEEMRPANMRGFAPRISGIANSNARVTISQNGYVVYQRFVPPGPFSFSDLPPTGQAGDMLVTITEADGTERKQVVAYSALPMMLRPGTFKYELGAGRYNGGNSSSESKNFIMATGTYGLPYYLTLYGGSLLANHYFSGALGAGISLGQLGAITTDVITSSAKLTGEDLWRSGAAYRMRYAKSLLATGTTLDLAAYRYFTPNYYSFNEVNQQYTNKEGENQAFSPTERRKSSFSVQLSQDFGRAGSLYLSGQRDEYRQTQKVSNTLSLGYNVNLYGVNYGANYSISRVKSKESWPEDRQLSLSVQVPFSLFSASTFASRHYLTYNMSRSRNGSSQQQSGISGSALDSKLSYQASKAWGPGNSNGALSMAYSADQMNANVGYSAGNNYHAINWGLNGAVLAHPRGMTLGKFLGSTSAVVTAPNAQGTAVSNGGGQLNGYGMAVLPYLSSYQKNIISLDPSTLPDEVELTQSSTTVYPTKGAVLLTEFTTRIGHQALIKLHKQGKPLPFGAIVTVEEKGMEPLSAIVADQGQVYLTGLSQQGQLSASWGSESHQRCQASYDLSGAKPLSANNPLLKIALECTEK